MADAFRERTLRLARPLSAGHLLTLRAGLRKADGYRLLSAFDALAAAPALERPLLAPLHGACPPRTKPCGHGGSQLPSWRIWIVRRPDAEPQRVRPDDR